MCGSSLWMPEFLRFFSPCRWGVHRLWGLLTHSVFLHLCSTLRTLQVRLAIRSLSPRDLSSSANNWQNQDSNLVLLTLHCCSYVGRERWCLFTKFLLSSPEESLLCIVSVLNQEGVAFPLYRWEDWGSERGSLWKRAILQVMGSTAGLVASCSCSSHSAGLPCYPQLSMQCLRQQKLQQVISQQVQRQSDSGLGPSELGWVIGVDNWIGCWQCDPGLEGGTDLTETFGRTSSVQSEQIWGIRLSDWTELSSSWRL